jgi:hypothetical protein
MPPETAHSNSIRMPPSFSFPCVLPVVRLVLVLWVLSDSVGGKSYVHYRVSLNVTPNRFS